MRKNTIPKKAFALLMAVVLLVSTVAIGISGVIAAAASASVTKTDDAIISVPETVYMTPSTGASTTGQYYVNNVLPSGSSAVNLETSATNTNGYVQFYIPGAKDVKVSVNTVTDGIGDIVLHDAGSTSGSHENTSLASLIDANGYFSYKTAGLYISGTGIAAGNTALAEWVFTVTMSDGTTRTYYAYSTLYAPFYAPVGAAAHSVSSKTWGNGNRQAWAGSILWVSGVHGYSAYSGSYNSNYYLGAYYPNPSSFIPMLNVISTPNNNAPTNGSQWITATGSTVPTITYTRQEADGNNNHLTIFSVSPMANMVVDTSRYNNFNQIPNFKVGLLVTDLDKDDSSEWYMADYTGYTADMSCDRSSTGSRSDHETYYDRAKGENIASGNGVSCGVKYHGTWNKSVSSSGTYQIKAALVGDETGGAIKRSAWNMDFVQMNVTAVSKNALRQEVLRGTTLNANNYTSSSWSAYQTQLRAAAQKLGNPASSTVDTSALTAARDALQTTVTLNANGGSIGTTSFNQTVGAASTYNYPVSSYVPTRTGYTFKGWSTSSTATSGSTSTVSAGLMPTLYAVWEANTYNVVFDNLVDFSAWNTSSASDATISNVTSNGFTLTSNEGVGEGTSSSPFFPVEPGKQYKIDIDFSGDNWDVYIFFCDANGNWIDFSDGTNRYSSNGSTGISKDNAVFTAPSDSSVVKAQIRLDANGSSNAVTFSNIRVYEVGTVEDGVSYEASKAVTYDSTYGTLPTPTREHYNFLGWYTSDGTKINASDTVKTAGNIYVTSKWEPVKYTVKWVYADGTEKSETLDYGETLTAPHNTSKPTDSENHYSYSWSPAVTATVVGNATYTEELTTTAHAWSEWTVQIAPTCTSEGARTRTCSVGGEIDSEVLSPLGHSYDKVVTPPTCTAEGYTTYTCTLCGDSYISDKVPAVEHTLEEVIDIVADCTQTGIHHYECTECDYRTENESTPALGHTWGDVIVDVPPTCTNAGSQHYECIVCSEGVSKPEEIPELGHSVGDWEVTTYPTFDAEGLKTKSCANCEYTETEALKPVKLRTTRIISSEIEGNTITIVGYTNADSIGFYRTTAAGEDIIFDMYYDEEDLANEPTPIKYGDNSPRWIIYNSRWSQYAVDGKYTDKVTIAGVEYNFEVIMNSRELEANDVVLVEKFTNIEVDNENKVITLIPPKGTESITLKQTSREYDEFTYTIDADNYDNVTLNAVSGAYRGSYTISANGEFETEITVTVNKNKYCQEEYTLKVIFIDFDLINELKPLRGTASIETYEDGREYIKVTMADGQTSTGIYKTGKGTAITDVSVELENGTMTENDNLYVGYVKTNKANPTGEVTISLSNGSVLTYDIVFDMGIVETEVDPLAELKLIRASAALDADGTLRITRNSGLAQSAGAGFYAVTTEGETVTFTTTQGTIYSGRTDAFVAYLTQNTSNVKGTLSYKLSDGTEVEYNTVIDLGLGDEYVEPEEPAYDVVKELKAIRGTVSVEENTVTITVAEGKTMTGVYNTTASGYAVEIKDANGTFADRTDAYVAYINANSANVEGTMTVTLDDGTFYEYAVIFDLGL